jgi:hypothetical protein
VIEYGSRTRRLPAPPGVVWDDLVSPQTALHFTLLAAGDPPDDSKTGHIRRRVSQLLFADLRFSYGQ